MKKHNAVLPALILFAGVFVVMTYPLLFRITSCIPAFFSTDESYAILWNAWWMKFSLFNHLPFKICDYLSYPFGVNLYPGNLLSYGWFLINFILPVLTNPVLTYNIQVFANFILCALFMYLLMFFISGDRRAALFSGIAYGFCPYLFVRSWQHLGETYVWPLPFILWSVFKLKSENTRINKIIFIISLVVSAINYAVFYYAAVVMGIYCLRLLFNYKENRNYLWRIILLSLLAFILLIPQFFPIFKNLLSQTKNINPSAWNIYCRPFEDLFAQSARPLSYILPAAVHPIFGSFTEQLVGSKIYGESFTEHTLYLGWVNIILSFVAFKSWRRALGDKRVYNQDSYYIGIFTLLLLTSWLFSQPPWWNILGFKIYMPSFFMYKIIPMFRAYCRFGIVVMMTVAVLAGLGFKIVLDKIKNNSFRLFVTGAFFIWLLFEFWNYPPYRVIDVSKPPAAYNWIKEQPKDTVIANYPLDSGSPNEMYRLYQVFHEKKMVNYMIPGSEAHTQAQSITNISDPKVAIALARMGVKYILVHKESYLKTGLTQDSEELGKISRNKNIRLIQSYPPEECDDSGLNCISASGSIDLYEVLEK